MHANTVPSESSSLNKRKTLVKEKLPARSSDQRSSTRIVHEQRRKRYASPNPFPPCHVEDGGFRCPYQVSALPQVPAPLAQVPAPLPAKIQLIPVSCGFHSSRHKRARGRDERAKKPSVSLRETRTHSDAGKCEYKHIYRTPTSRRCKCVGVSQFTEFVKNDMSP